MAAFPAQPATSRYGLVVNTLAPIVPWDPIKPQTYDTLATLVRQANVGWVRVSFNWHEIAADEYKRDTSLIDWTTWDAVMNAASCRGLNVLGNVAYSPSWATRRPELAGVPDSLRPYYLPDDLADWARFVRAIVNHYPQIRYWSIWNEPNAEKFFRGSGWELTSQARVPAYNALVQAAASHIRGNYDAQGRRYLVAAELAGGLNDGSDLWLESVLAEQGQNVDVVAVHAYGEAFAISSYMRGLSGRINVPSWPWPVWLTEVGPTGCNEGQTDARRDTLGYCVALSTPLNSTKKIYIDDTYQLNHLQGVISAMLGTSPARLWERTFYWHSHVENGAEGAGNDYGILRGARWNSMFARRAFQRLAEVAGHMPTSGPNWFSGNASFTVSVTSPVPGTYYYVWDRMRCSTLASIGCKTTTYQSLAAGQDLLSVSTGISATDREVNVRVRQYQRQGGHLLRTAIHMVQGGAAGAAAPQESEHAPLTSPDSVP